MAIIKEIITDHERALKTVSELNISNMSLDSCNFWTKKLNPDSEKYAEIQSRILELEYQRQENTHNNLMRKAENLFKKVK